MEFYTSQMRWYRQISKSASEKHMLKGMRIPGFEHLWLCVCVCVCVCVCACARTRMLTQSCPNLCNPMDCSPPGSSVHKIFQARILEWVAISFSQPRDQNHISHLLYLLHRQAGSLPAEQPRETIWGSRLRQSQREWIGAASHRRKGGNWIELRMRFLGWWECSRSSVGWLAQKYTQ